MTRGALLGALAGLALVSFHLVGSVFLDGFALDLGSTDLPTPRYLALVAFWMPFGALASVLLAAAIATRAETSSRASRLAAEWAAISDRRFVWWTCAAACAVPLVIRYVLLGGARLTDDEPVYRFAAELLASGRLSVPSMEPKIFFDQNFMINDGRLYGMYFLGWPALLAPATIIGVEGFVNPLLSALTIPALFSAVRQLAGSSWARGAVCLFLAAPFVQVMAATLLSHTSCLMALTWCFLLCLRSTTDDARPWHHAAFAFAASLAVFIRPQSAVPVVLPLVAWWLIVLIRKRRSESVRAALAFAVPAVVMAGLFLAVLAAQNGSPWRPGYIRYAEYIQENRYRFTGFTAADPVGVRGFDFSEVGVSIARTATALFRLNVDLFGWPSSFVFVLFALPVRSRATGILWTVVASYLLLLLFKREWGIDTFGPMHAFELTLPLIGLSIVGARNIGEHLAWRGNTSDTTGRGLRAFAPSLLAALIVTAWLGFIPYRLAALQRIAAHVNVAETAPKRHGVSRAVVFAPFPFAPRCSGVPFHYVFFRPVNDPDLANDILWLNHIDLEQDRRMAARFADRPAYLMQWTPACDATLVPLDAVGSDSGGTARVIR